MKKVDFDQYARNYNELLRESTGFFSPDESYFAQYKVAIARKLVPRSPRRVLEFGCGIGRNIPFLRQAFPDAEVMGCDVSRLSIEKARSENPGVRFWVNDEEDCHELFDFIFVAGVFHHIPPGERGSAARYLAERLKSGACAVVFEHNPYNPITRRIVNDCPYDEGVILLKPGELRGLLRGAGLGEDQQGYALFVPPRFKSVAGIEPWLSWLPLGGQYWVKAQRA